jgi:hypothetical protein
MLMCLNWDIVECKIEAQVPPKRCEHIRVIFDEHTHPKLGITLGSYETTNPSQPVRKAVKPAYISPQSALQT